MILTSRGRDREVRFAAFDSSRIPSPGSLTGTSTAGVAVNANTAYGLPAAMQAIRQPSVLIASLELAVFIGRDADKRRVDESWQAALLAKPDGGTDGLSAFDWMSDIASAVDGFGNGFARKIHGVGRLKGQILALDPIHPDNVWVKRKDGVKKFKVRVDNRTVEGLTSHDILHIRDFVPGGWVAAASPVAMHRNPLGIALGLEEFQGRYFANDARPPAYFTFPEGITEDQAKRWIAIWNEQHKGLRNRGKIGVMGGGATLTPLPLSLEDAQFIESQQFSIEQIARIFNWPAWALDHNEAKETESAESRARNLLTFYLRPRLERIQASFRADPDLFGGSNLYPEFLAHKLISIDAKTQAEVDHFRVQDGTWLRDEIRAEYGKPPLPDGVGQIPLVTPVGAGANPEPIPKPSTKE